MEKLFAQVDQLNNDEFEQLIIHVDKQKRRRAREILAEAQRQAARFVQDLEGGKSVKAASARSNKPARFANPKNTNQTWSGHGRQPEWFKAHLAAGGKEDELLIKA